MDEGAFRVGPVRHARPAHAAAGLADAVGDDEHATERQHDRAPTLRIDLAQAPLELVLEL